MAKKWILGYFLTNIHTCIFQGIWINQNYVPISWKWLSTEFSRSNFLLKFFCLYDFFRNSEKLLKNSGWTLMMWVFKLEKAALLSVVTSIFGTHFLHLKWNWYMSTRCFFPTKLTSTKSKNSSRQENFCLYIFKRLFLLPWTDLICWFKCLANVYALSQRSPPPYVTTTLCVWDCIPMVCGAQASRWFRLSSFPHAHQDFQQQQQ